MMGLSGCAQKKEEMLPFVDTAAVTPVQTMGKGPYNYLALGDSYTIGEMVNISQSFPYQLAARLSGEGFPVNTPTIIAQTGWTTSNLISAITGRALTSKFDFVTLLIGVNNQYQGLSQDTYRTEFVQLLNTAINFANNNKLRVYVVSIPDYSVTPFATGLNQVKIATEINQFNMINKEESAKAGVNYVDITPISRQAATDPTLIAPDGLHPSAKMYGLWIPGLNDLLVKSL